MTRDEIVSLFTRRHDALMRHDVATLASLFSEDCVVDSPLAGGSVQGRAANAKLYRAFFDAFPDVALTVDERIVDGDRVAEIGTLTGTDTGGLMGMVASHKPAIIPIVIFCRVANNAIVYERRIYDFTGMLVQIGVLKAKPA